MVVCLGQQPNQRREPSKAGPRDTENDERGIRCFASHYPAQGELRYSIFIPDYTRYPFPVFQFDSYDTRSRRCECSPSGTLQADSSGESYPADDESVDQVVDYRSIKAGFIITAFHLWRPRYWRPHSQPAARRLPTVDSKSQHGPVPRSLLAIHCCSSHGGETVEVFTYRSHWASFSDIQKWHVSAEGNRCLGLAANILRSRHNEQTAKENRVRLSCLLCIGMSLLLKLFLFGGTSNGVFWLVRQAQLVRRCMAIYQLAQVARGYSCFFHYGSHSQVDDEAGGRGPANLHGLCSLSGENCALFAFALAFYRLSGPSLVDLLHRLPVWLVGFQ